MYEFSTWGKATSSAGLKPDFTFTRGPTVREAVSGTFLESELRLLAAMATDREFLKVARKWARPAASWITPKAVRPGR